MKKYFKKKIDSIEELQRLYKKLCKKLHPDKGGSDEDFKAMQAEYNTLKKSIEGYNGGYEAINENKGNDKGDYKGKKTIFRNAVKEQRESPKTPNNQTETTILPIFDISFDKTKKAAATLTDSLVNEFVEGVIEGLKKLF